MRSLLWDTAYFIDVVYGHFWLVLYSKFLRVQCSYCGKLYIKPPKSFEIIMAVVKGGVWTNIEDEILKVRGFLQKDEQALIQRHRHPFPNMV